MRELTQFLNENHRYFPEWADRPETSGPPVEADHNSYLAGGYSEEFGYRVSVDQPPVFSPLDGDPDGSRLWYVQVTGLHPGYPECARPDDRSRFGHDGKRDGTEEARRARTGPIDAGDSAGTTHKSAPPIHVIWVGGRARRGTPDDSLATRVTSLWRRWRPAHRGCSNRLEANK